MCAELEYMEMRRRALQALQVYSWVSLELHTDLVPLQPMKAVPSVLRYLGKCTADFSSNCVHTLVEPGDG